MRGVQSVVCSVQCVVVWLSWTNGNVWCAVGGV
jgi:hypothetical protein